MKTPSRLSHFSIHAQILIGFLPIMLILGLWLFSSQKSFHTFSGNFTSLLKIEEEGHVFIEIQRDIMELQRNVLVYSHVGYRGVLKKIDTLEKELEERFEKIRPTAEQDETTKNHFNRLYNHYGNYKEVFTEAVKKKEHLKNLETGTLIPTIKKNHDTITNLIQSAEHRKDYKAAYIASKIELDLLHADANIKSFSTRPDATIVRATHTLITNIKNNIDLLQEHDTDTPHHKHISTLSSLIDDYQNIFIEITTLNRIYTHLMNVVLAGKAAEINTLSRELEELINKRSEMLSKNITQDIQTSQIQYILLSICAGIIGIISAFFIATGIAGPVNAMATTLAHLAKGEANVEIPGQNRKDEVGQMAKAANAFKNMALRLDERMEFERLITNSIPDLVFVKDKDFKIIQANDAFLNVYPEENRDQIIGKTSFEKFRLEEFEKFTENDRLAFKNGFNEVEETILFPNGETKTLFTKKVRFKNHKGEEFILGIARDITDLKKATRALEQQKEMLELGEETAKLGHWHLDAINNTVYWSDQTYKIHGTSPEKYTPTVATAINYYHPDDREDIENIIQNALTNKEPFEFEKEIVTDQGQTAYIHSIGHPDFNDEGALTGIFGVIQDITDRKTSEEALLRSNKELDDFAYIASHDLKEPLRGLHNHARFLLEDYEDKLDEDGKHKLGRLIYLSQRMEKLTSDLLYYSRLGRAEKQEEDIDLNEIVLDIKNLLADKENTSIEIKGTLPCIKGECVRIEELYRNLITNGIKYNESTNKEIEVGVSKDGSLYVKDNGIGIDPKFHKDIFKIFKRLHKRESYGGGTGSGLTFVKKIIDRHNGHIWVKSEIGQGTEFHFTLPQTTNKKKEPS